MKILTITTTSYNTDKLLSHLLNSFEELNFKYIEIIIVDDGSKISKTSFFWNE